MRKNLIRVVLIVIALCMAIPVSVQGQDDPPSFLYPHRLTQNVYTNRGVASCVNADTFYLDGTWHSQYINEDPSTTETTTFPLVADYDEIYYLVKFHATKQSVLVKKSDCTIIETPNWWKDGNAFCSSDERWIYCVYVPGKIWDIAQYDWGYRIETLYAFDESQIIPVIQVAYYGQQHAFALWSYPVPNQNDIAY